MQTILKYIEYPIGLTVGFIGQSLGIAEFFNLVLLSQKIADGFIGLFFVSISVVLTHYIKKYLEKKDDIK